MNLGAIDKAAEGHALFTEDGGVTHAVRLVAAAIGEDRSVPSHQSMRSAKALDAIAAGTKEQVIRVVQNNLTAGTANLRRVRPFIAAAVATGMNAGVSKEPCGVVTRPRRARFAVERARISN